MAVFRQNMRRINGTAAGRANTRRRKYECERRALYRYRRCTYLLLI